MALIRSVLQHPHHGRWAYVEYSDESKTHSIEMGGKNFATQDEAWEYSKGFEPFSYEWNEPSETKRKRLLDEKDKIEKRLKEINEELI